ncbi:MAG: YIP1 family protein [Candidatus Aenigmarchaeota archaeon]|nr:YIP1 family protein [Candidatus Aenigmarchaeota archaeon]
MEWLFTWLENVRLVLTKPGKFFSKMPKKSIIEPLKFAGINITLYSILASLLSVPNLGSGLLDVFTKNLIGGALEILVMSILVFLTMKFVGGKGSYEATMRVFCFSSATKLFQWIPFIGMIAGFYSLLYLNVVGLSYAHKVSKGRALLGVSTAIVLSIVYIFVVVAHLFGFRF